MNINRVTLLYNVINSCIFTVLITTKTNKMTTLETRLKAISLIDKIITLKENVSNGCEADEQELEEQFPRLEDIRVWAIKNNQIKEIQHYFASHNFGENGQFIAAEISTIFHTI